MRPPRCDQGAAAIGYQRRPRRKPLLAGDQVRVGKVEQDMIRPRIFRNPQRRHRTVTSSARCAVRRQAKSVRQPSYPRSVLMRSTWPSTRSLA